MVAKRKFNFTRAREPVSDPFAALNCIVNSPHCTPELIEEQFERLAREEPDQLASFLQIVNTLVAAEGALDV